MLIENILYPPIKNYQKSLITSKFNAVRGNKKHKGLDIGVKSGTEVFAPADGVVIDSDPNRSTCGGFIKIKHDDDIVTKYCHLRKVLVKPKDVVKVGQLIGLSGGDQNDPGKGHTTGAHLHFEVIRRGEFLNPEDVISGQLIPKDVNNEPIVKYDSYDFSQKLKDDSYDFSGKNTKNNITVESVKDKPNYSLTEIGSIIQNSFNSSEDNFSSDYMYNPDATKFYCKFKTCKVNSTSSSNCHKISVSHNSKNYIVKICSEDINFNKKNAVLGDLIASFSQENSYIDVTVTLGLTSKIKLKEKQKKQSEPYKFSKNDDVDTGYTFPTTSQTNSFVSPYDFSSSNITNSLNQPYDFSLSNISKSFTEPYKFENKIISKQLINEINRIISIMK